MRRLLTLFLCMAIQLCNAQVYWNALPKEKWSQGSGTELDPYLIEKPQHLSYLSDSVNKGATFENVYFKLTGDLYMNTQTHLMIPIGYGAGNKGFSGNFDGNNKTIQVSWYFNPSIMVADSNYGLFGILNESGCIKNLTLGDSSRMGAYDKTNIGALVGLNKGEIRNCHFQGQINGNWYNIGALVGMNDVTGIIDSCSNQGRILGVQYNGGIAGWNKGIIRNCSNLNHAEGAIYTGGIAGVNDTTGSIEKCFSSGLTLGGSSPYEMGSTAGIAAINHGTINQCFNSGKVHSSLSIAAGAGLVGTNYGTLKNSFNTGTVAVEGSTSPGAGITYINEEKGIIEACYSAALISGSDSLSGDIFVNKNLEANSFYYDYQLFSQLKKTEKALYTQTLTGSKLKGFEESIWQMAEGHYPALKSFEDNPYALLAVTALNLFIDETRGIVDKPEQVMHSFHVGIPSSVSFKENSNLIEIKDDSILVRRPQTFDSSATITFSCADITSDKVITIMMEMEGYGTEQEPFLINNYNDMVYLRTKVYRGNLFYNTYFKVTDNIDMQGPDKTWTPIGQSSDNRKIPFSGHFDGNGHTLYNLHIKQPDNSYVGLFGVLNNGGSIRNLRIGNNSSIEGRDNVGGIVGEAYGLIENCSNQADVKGNSFVGGVVGYYFGFGNKLSNLYNTGNITGNSYCSGGIVGGIGDATLSDSWNMGTISAKGHSCGGIVGSSTANIIRCYNAGNISGTEYVGGIAGISLDSAIIQCYNMGKVTGDADAYGPIVSESRSESTHIKYLVNDCYFDKQTCPSTYQPESNQKITGLLTVDFLQSEGLDDFDSNWIFSTNHYPLLKKSAMDTAAQVSVAAAVLYNDGNTFETVDSVTHNLSFKPAFNIQWSTSNEGIVTDEGEIISVPETEEVEIYAQSGEYTKSIRIHPYTCVGNERSTPKRYSVTNQSDVIIINNLGEVPATFSIYNIKGQLVERKRSSTARICSKVQAPGLYLIHIQDAHGTQTQKTVCSF